MGKESASPRGRIHLVKLAAEHKIDPIRDMMQSIDLCLGCRACETACPVGVLYGHILEAAKEEIYRNQSLQPTTPINSLDLSCKKYFLIQSGCVV
jgi:glycolate oxidase iron-sulfur subunit